MALGKWRPHSPGAGLVVKWAAAAKGVREAAAVGTARLGRFVLQSF